MKVRILPALLLSCLLLGGCASLLERSYSVVEPYTDRYRDTGAEDTLRAESYQDLVNSLLMLVEQRTDEGVIRCYDEANSYQQAQAARDEVRRETALGSYLLEDLSFDYEHGSAYSTLTYQMTYREGTEDIGSIMTLSDSQSLVDLLRLHVREDHERLAAQFVYDTPRGEVIAAVESFWQELCAGELEDAREDVPPADSPEAGEAGGAPADAPDPSGGGDIFQTEQEGAADVPAAEPVPPAAEEVSPASEPPQAEVPAGPPLEGGEAPAGDPPEAEPVVYPPCPWTVRFYPDQEMASIVEILLTGS